MSSPSHSRNDGMRTYFLPWPQRPDLDYPAAAVTVLSPARTFWEQARLDSTHLSKRFASWKPKPTRLRNPLSTKPLQTKPLQTKSLKTKPLKTELLSTKLLHCNFQSEYVDGDLIGSGA